MRVVGTLSAIKGNLCTKLSWLCLHGLEVSLLSFSWLGHWFDPRRRTDFFCFFCQFFQDVVSALVRVGGSADDGDTPGVEEEMHVYSIFVRFLIKSLISKLKSPYHTY